MNETYKELNFSQKVLLRVLEEKAQTWVCINNDVLSQLTGASRRTIIKNLKFLKDQDYISTFVDPINNKRMIKIK